jgi:trehalose 6-phosphate phosphatase
MTQLLTEPAGRRALEDVVGAGGLLAFEFDGTLAPVVHDRASAAPKPATRELLTRIAAVHPCAVISGRARQDLLERLRGIPLVEVVGNHGAEPTPAGTDELLVRRRVALWHAVLAPSLLEIPGVEIEDKRLSLAIHFRRARDQAGAERRVRLALRRATGARLIEGACAVDMVPEELPDQGSALKRLCAQLGVKAALFVGGGAAHAVVARAEIPGLVAVQVGGPASGATYFVEDQAGVDGILEAVLELASRRGPAQGLASVARG